MSKPGDFQDQSRAMLAQKRQVDDAGRKLAEIGATLNAVQTGQDANQAALDSMVAQIEYTQASDAIVFVDDEEDGDIEIIVPSGVTIEIDMEVALPKPAYTIPAIQPLDSVQMEGSDDWQGYMARVEAYCERNRVHGLESPFAHLMTDSQRIELERRIKREFTIHGPCCDKYDYMIAGTCGLIGGLLDVLLVGMPGEGVLTKAADEWTDAAVRKFATVVGWKGPKEGSDPTASAIGFLERKFKVNYDHQHGGAVDGQFKMSTGNHHIKSLAHSPDLVGLFFSILDQFTSTAHFVSDGKLIAVNTETFELRGGTLPAKLFSGFANWLGHLFSDMAGSSGAAGRGSGIPIPFYSLLQFINVGEFGQHKQTFATIAVRVFEQGYDMRHGIAMTIPVCAVELFTRLAWTCKARFYHQRPWNECVPSGGIPELQRMLLVAQGTLCVVDVVDAGLRSGGDMVQFLLRSNLIAWARFGTLALKTLRDSINQGNIDAAAVDSYLEAEYRRMLRT